MTDAEKIKILVDIIRKLENHIRSKSGESELLKQVRDLLDTIK
jgi:hypothetical protein